MGALVPWVGCCSAGEHRAAVLTHRHPHPQVVDVFAMPQSGTGVSVEAVDPVFQTKMLDMLKQVGR